jgi:Tol biopolymer transport system component
MNADGSNPVRLTSSPSSDRSPAWSPDGARIAFATDRDGNAEIYLMNVDGTGLTRVTNDPDEDTEPDWSPDGHAIAFTHGGPGYEHAYVMNLEGTLIASIGEGSGPAWSPDGSQLAFSFRVCSEDLANNWCWRSIVLTGDWRFLTYSPIDWIHPAWSPSGKKLAYVEGPGDRIFVVHIDRYDTAWYTHGFHPAWRR